MTKISSLTALTGAGADAATDLFPIVDMSETGAARNKKITVAEAKEAIAPGTAAALDIDIDDTLAANSDALIPTQQAVKAYVDANVGGANDLDDLSDVDLTGLADGDTLVYDSGSGDFVPVPLPGGGAGGTVPDGGTTGQVLAKASATDQDLAWVGGRGTSFPGSPATGDRFLRTDRNIDYFYDGTRWLSTTLYHGMPTAAARALQPLSATTNPLAYWLSPHSTTYAIYIETVKHQAVMTGTGNWTIQLQDNSGAVISQVANITASDFTSVAVNATSADYRQVRSAAIENSGTATLDYLPSFSYRLVG